MLSWLPKAKRRILRRSEGEEIILERFASNYGRTLDVSNPQTFTEKLFCRMLRWNRRMDPRFATLVDKLAVRTYVASTVGAGHLIELLWHGSDPENIPFGRLNAPYVVKANHGCDYVTVVKGTADRDDITRRASIWVENNLYWVCREAQYYDIEPKVMVEEFLANPDGSDVLIYKFWCFDGVPRLLSVSDKTRSIAPYYDTDWNRLELTHAPHLPRPCLERPRRFEEMLSIAARLSEGIDFVRVDLYNPGDRVYFSELTFTPRAGIFKFEPVEWDLKLGKMWAMRD